MTTAQIVSEIFYSLIGIVFILVGVKALRDPKAEKKSTTACFWFRPMSMSRWWMCPRSGDIGF